MSTVSAALSLERGNKSADVRRDPGRRAPMDKLIWITEQIIVPIIRIHKFMHAFASDFIPEKSAGEIAFFRMERIVPDRRVRLGLCSVSPVSSSRNGMLLVPPKAGLFLSTV